MNYNNEKLNNKKNSICPKCNGTGVYYYPNSGTYRKQTIVMQAFTEDTCDKCWGSGDDKHPNMPPLE